MNSRELILNKLNKNKNLNQTTIPETINDREIFKDYPDKKSLLDLFAKRFKALSGELHIAKDINEAGKNLESIFSSFEDKTCITFSSELIKNMLSNVPDTAKLFDVLENENLDSQIFANYAAGLTTADFLIARTGSIVLNSLNHGGRRISVLPPIHIVVAETNQILLSLDEIFNKDFISVDWSYATIISGPSRTSDIEKQLVLGAHGPKRLIVILIENI